MFRTTVAPLQRLCLALLLATGFAVLFGIAVGLGNQARKAFPGGNGSDSFERVVFTSGGEVLVEMQSFNGRSWRFSYKSLDGTVIAGHNNRSRALTIEFLSPQPRKRGASIGLEQTVKYLASVGSEHWYLVVHRDTQDGLCYFAGFNASDRMPVGFLGAEGFQTERPAESEMLPVHGSPLLQYGRLPMIWAMRPPNSMQPVAFFLLSNGRLLKVEPGRRSVTLALEIDDIVNITDVTDPAAWSRVASAGQSGDVVASHVLLRRPASVLHYDPITDTAHEFPLTEEMQQQVFEFYPQSDEQAVLVLWNVLGYRSATIDVVFIDRQGNVTERFDDVPQGWGRQQSATDDSLFAAYVVPAPLISFLWTALQSTELYLEVDYTLANALVEGWPGILLTCLVGGVCAFLAVRRQRACGQPRSLQWGVFVFMLGLPGYVGYRLHRRWPICEQPPPPERNGLEILA